MECNRDEAIRSREIAEQKFMLHDLAGAMKFALKAQHLFPGLEGVPQLLAVLDVHIVAQDKVDGLEPDWYGILQTHAAADETTIRKQYRKLALDLHPDKNKAVGAEGAFMLISEAWRTLSDKAKKAAHDAKRKHKGISGGFRNFTSFSTQKWPNSNSGKSAHPLWIKCPSCQNEVQCSRIEGKMVECAACHHTFVGSRIFRAKEDHSESRGNGNPSNSSCVPEDSLKGAFTPFQGGPEKSFYMREGNVRHDRKDDAGVAEGISRQQSDEQADGIFASWQDQKRPDDAFGSRCAQTRTTNMHTNFQCFWGSHGNRTPLGHSPAAAKATSEMVQNVYETVRRERVKAQREAQEKVMKERIEAEKELRRGRREQKQRRKEEDLKKQAKAAQHAKKAFDKLFAREQKILGDDGSYISKASFGCTNGALSADNLGTNHEVDQINVKSHTDTSDC
ncbi:hypothetical protein L7F22_021746 [Adiantum nelumboides]|nr:hypothetical protein [Adiantum nelumboides]